MQCMKRSGKGIVTCPYKTTPVASKKMNERDSIETDDNFKEFFHSKRALDDPSDNLFMVSRSNFY